jgi:hypothetical protein
MATEAVGQAKTPSANEWDERRRRGVGQPGLPGQDVGLGGGLTLDDVLARVQAVIRDDPEPYRTPPYSGEPNPFAGTGYPASEAVQWLAARLEHPVTLHPARIWLDGPHGPDAHWYLTTDLKGRGDVVDATAEQFAYPLSYTTGSGGGFASARPSKRGRELLLRALLGLLDPTVRWMTPAHRAHLVKVWPELGSQPSPRRKPRQPGQPTRKEPETDGRESP